MGWFVFVNFKKKKKFKKEETVAKRTTGEYNMLCLDSALMDLSTGLGGG